MSESPDVGSVNVHAASCFSRACLAAALLLRGIGVCQKYLWSSFEIESAIFGVLFFEWHWPEQLALRVDDWCVRTYLFAGVLAVGQFAASTFPRLPDLIGMRWARVGQLAGAASLMFCVAWEVALVASICERGEAFSPVLTPAGHALRFAIPLTLVVANFGVGSRLVQCFLRWAVALTFLGHGLNAWMQDPVYTSFILATVQSFHLSGIEQATAEVFLRIISVMDLIVAVAVLAIPSRWRVFRWLILYAAVWGFLTAASRMTASGVWVWHETLLRTSHFLGPAALFGFWFVGKPSAPVASRE